MYSSKISFIQFNYSSSFIHLFSQSFTNFFRSTINALTLVNWSLSLSSGSEFNIIFFVKTLQEIMLYAIDEILSLQKH